MEGMDCASPSEEGASGPVSILLVEDDRINQKLMLLMLSRLGIKPVVAERGEDAVALVRESRFDLVFMDLHMPGMHGIEAARRIREALGDASPPIVALTADAVIGNEQTVLEQGLRGFLTKPVNTQTLRGCIERHTGFRFG